jgi:nucleoid DNA-binding protein
MAKKAAAKKATKKTANKAAAAAPKPAKITAAGKLRSKSEVFGAIAEQTGLNRRQVASVFETMGQMIGADLGKGGPGIFNVPGLMKIVVQHKPATKARKGINPFTKQETIFKAKPARKVVKVRPLKALKDMVA